MSGDVIEKSGTKNSAIGYIFCFLLFFVVGTALGIYCTQKYLDKRDEENSSVEEQEKFQDITENSEYTTLIKELSSMVDSYSFFYSTAGMNANLMSNDLKIKYSYDSIIANKEYVDTSINALWYGSETCEYDFLVENITNADGSTYTTGACSLKRISKVAFLENYQKVFNSQQIDVNTEFIVNDNIKCIVDGEDFLCGSIAPVTGITGDLVPKFSVQKVLKEEDGTIFVYEKGYLQDMRSNIQNPEDGHEKYYLHSSDSTTYYYELKSADNITFKHTFKPKTDGTYYYVSSEVSK